MTLSISGSHTFAAPAEPTWYEAPVTALQHAFGRSFRSACHSVTWQASFGIVGPLEAVDRSKACQACLIVTGAVVPAPVGTPGELRDGWGK